MVYFSLPYFYENQKFNYFLYKYVETYPEQLRFKFKIESFYGNLPFSFWNGDLNTCTSLNRKVILNNAVDEIVKKSVVPIKFDVSNIYLNHYDFFDTHLNMILKKFEGMGNFLKISDFNFYDFIESNYIGYDFILSENIFLLGLEENIAAIPENKIAAIELPSFLNKDIDFLKNIENKNKIFITIGDGCQDCFLEKIEQCKKEEMQFQILFSQNSIYNYCKKGFCHNKLLEEFNKISECGFTHFKIKAPQYNDIDRFNHFLVQFLFKPQHQYEFILRFKQEEINLI